MALADKIIAFWKLGEASGTRADSIGSNDLDDINTVTQNPGKIGNAAQFTNANNEVLTHSDNSALSTGDIDFTAGAWVYLDNKSTLQLIVAKWGTGDSNHEWLLAYHSGRDRFYFRVSADGGEVNGDTVDADELGSPSVEAWYFILVWHDSANDTINIQINDGPIDSKAYALGLADKDGEFSIGGNPTPGDALDGRVDAVLWAKAILTQLERTQIHNAGNGLEPPFLVSTYTEPVTVVTQVCDSDTGFSKEMVLPRFSNEKDDPDSIAKFLDQQAEVIEDKYNNQVARSVPCDICVTDGAVVLDCGQCIHVEIAADEDINSISFINCFPGDELDILFRASKDVIVSGWPSNFTCPSCDDPVSLKEGNLLTVPARYTGIGNPIHGDIEMSCQTKCSYDHIKDFGSGLQSYLDCWDACMGRGTAEETEGKAGGTSRGTGGSGSGGPTGACPCTPDEGGLLSVVVCTELDCDDDNPKIILTVCGGSGGYVWSVVGGETPTQTDSGSDDRNTKIEPPENTTPGEPGTAYGRGHAQTRSSRFPESNCVSLYQNGATYNCAGVKTGSCTNRDPSEIGVMPIKCEVPSVNPDPGGCQDPSGNQNSYCGYPCQHAGGCEPCEQATVDIRTQGMKDNGCKPCAATMEGVIVSVTDSDGTVVSTVIET